MIQFDEEDQNEKLEEIRRREQERLSNTLSDDYGVPYVDLTSKFISGNALATLEEDTARKANMAPFRLVDDTLSVAVYSPENEQTTEVLDELRKNGYEIELYMTSTEGLEKAWGMYADISRTSARERGTVNISDENVASMQEEINTVDDVPAWIKDALGKDKQTKTSQVMEIVLGGALATDASDVHLEPADDTLRVRYRIDGVLMTVGEIDHDTYSSILQRIKLVSEMKLNVKNEAQDGRFTIEVAERAIEIRTSVIPGPYGEGVVMRLLDPASIQVELEELGIHPRLLEVFKDQIKKPHGMILNTGPTGSGKTTTLYSFLREVNTPEVKILTIENPIEYHLDGIAQTQVNNASGYTFLSGLRSALRQDPDVIMVGEIREEETADVAINAALTGHLVFSTLHTNDAAGTFPRLVDLGVDPNVMTSAINMSMAQRLVRKLCSHCATARTPSAAEQKIIDRILKQIKRRDESYLTEIKTDTVYDANGCEECNNTGYSGRVGVFEAILSDEALEGVLGESMSMREIWKAVDGQGILTMQQDGVLKILDGVTSFAEVDRVLDLEEEK